MASAGVGGGSCLPPTPKRPPEVLTCVGRWFEGPTCEAGDVVVANGQRYDVTRCDGGILNGYTLVTHTSSPRPLRAIEYTSAWN